MSDPLCRVCDLGFADGERIIAVMLSHYKKIDSDMSYAIEQPDQCFELIHVACSDYTPSQEGTCEPN